MMKDVALILVALALIVGSYVAFGWAHDWQWRCLLVECRAAIP